MAVTFRSSRRRRRLLHRAVLAFPEVSGLTVLSVLTVVSALLSTWAVAAGEVRGTHPGAAGDQAVDVVYEPPVEAPVTDPFRPPAHFAGPGNRGLEYGVGPGAAVHAAADGTVVFAGAVADSLHVTILHADGIRTSYSYLGSLGVAVGQTVTRGQVVGATGATFHFGARDGDTYIDPAALFAPVRRARLVSAEAGAHGSVATPGGVATRGPDAVARAVAGAVDAGARVVADRLGVWSR